MCRRIVTYCWKDLDKGYNFALDLIIIRGFHAKLCAPKVVTVLVVGISRLPLGSPETKSHLNVAPMERCIVYYKGEGGGFPQVQAVLSLMSPRLPVVSPSTKNALTMHWPPCVGFVQVRVNSWSLSILPSPILEFQHAFLPLQSAMSQGMCPDFSLFHCFQFGLTFESLKELGTRHNMSFILFWIS
jgi:hypothetical protein